MRERRSRSARSPRRRLVVLGVIGLAVATAGGFVAWRQGVRRPAARAAGFVAAARASLERNDAAAAETFARAAMEEVPSPEAQALLGEALIRAGRTDEGVQALRDALDASPGNARAALLLANWLLGRGETATAAELAGRAVADRDFGAAALRLRGSIRLRAGDPVGGYADLTQAVSLRPDDASTCLLAGQVAAAVGRATWDQELQDAAEAHLRRAVTHAREDQHLVRAAALLELGDPAATLRELVRADPGAGLVLRAPALEALGRSYEAESLLRDALGTADGTRERAMLARCLARQGHVAAALSELQRAGTADRPDADVVAVGWEIRDRVAELTTPGDLVFAVLRTIGRSALPVGAMVTSPVLAADSPDAAVRVRLGLRGPAVIAEMGRGAARPEDVAAVAADVETALQAGRRDPLALAFAAALGLRRGDLAAAEDAATDALTGPAPPRNSSETGVRLRVLRALIRIESGALDRAQADLAELASPELFDVIEAVWVRLHARAGRSAAAVERGRAALGAAPDSVWVAAALSDALGASPVAGPADAGLRAEVEMRLRLARGDVSGAVDALRGAPPGAAPRPGSIRRVLDRLVADAGAESGGSPDAWEPLARRAWLLRARGRHADARAVLERSPLTAGSAELSVLLGVILLDERAVDRADAAFVRAIALRPDAWDAWGLRVRAAVAAERPEAARERLREILGSGAPAAAQLAAAEDALSLSEVPPEVLSAVAAWSAAAGMTERDAALLSARVAIASGSTDAALATLRSPAFRRDDAWDPDALALAATALLRAGRIDEAEAELSSGGVASPDSEPLLAARASVAAAAASRELNAGRSDAAQARWIDALAAQPGDLVVCIPLARSVDPADAAGAARIHDRVEGAVPGRGAGALFMGAWHRSGRRFDEAVRRLGEAAGWAPANSVVAALLVDSAILSGDAGAAAAAASAFSVAVGDDPIAWFLEGRAAEAAGDLESAERAYLRILDHDAGDVAALQRIVPLLVASGRSDEALGRIERARTGRPNRGAGEIAALLAAAGDVTSALAQLERIPAGRRDATSEFLRGRCLELAGNAAGAAAAFGAAADAAPAWVEPRFAWARCLFRTGRTADVQSFADAGVRDRPTDPVPLCLLAALAESRRDFAAAEALYRKATAAAPTFVVALNNLAWLLSEDLQRPGDALEPARRAFDAHPAEPSVADTYGWVLFRLGRSREAVAPLRFAARCRPSDAGILCRLAQALAASGDRKGASSALDAAARAAPADAEPARLRSALGL